MSATGRPLVRALTLTDVTCLVVGTVIGTGVFLNSAVMTQQLGAPREGWIKDRAPGPTARTIKTCSL